MRRAAVLPLARALLPLARSTWAALPPRWQAVLRPMVRRFRDAVGIGSWAQPDSRYAEAVQGVHSLVPVGPPPVEPLAVNPFSMPDSPTVSVIVTAHDDATYLSVCLQSVQRQHPGAWECIVVDDASTDETLDIALSFAEADNRFVVVRQDANLGLAASRNTGISWALGEYIAFLDADDYLFPDTLGVRVESARAADPRVVGSWCDWVSVPEAAGHEFVTTGAGDFETIDYETGGGENQIISSSPLLRRDVVESLGGLDNSFRTAEDFEFWTRLFRNGFRLRYAPVVGVAYRQKRVSMISGDPAGHARNAMAVYGYMAAPLEPAAVSSLATHPFVEPPAGIPSEIHRVERLVTFLTFAVLTDDDEQVAAVRDLLPAGLLGASSFLLDVDGRIDVALRRHSNRAGGLSRFDRDRAEATVKQIISERADWAGGATEIPAHAGVLNPARVTAGGGPRRHGRPIARGRLRYPDHRRWDVVIAPATMSGCADLLLVGRELVELGASVALLAPDDRPAVAAQARRRAAFDGVRFVGTPCGPATVVVTSAVVSPAVTAEHHVVISSEPLLTAPTAGVEPDLVLCRAQWEAHLCASSGPTEVTTWLTRLERVRMAARPRDGQGTRRRQDTVLVLGDRAEETAVRLSSFDVVFGRAAPSPIGLAITADRIPLVAAAVRAVVATGGSLPVDALTTGTPVIGMDDLRWAEGTPGLTLSDLDTLAADLTGAYPTAVDLPAETDWLGHHVRAVAALAGLPVDQVDGDSS